MEKSKLRNDIILITSLLLVAVIALVVLLTRSIKSKLVAKVYVQDLVMETIDLAKTEERDFYVNGVNGVVHIHTKENAIAVVESTCPHKDCVNMGYVSETNRPIICAYNAVYIVIEGQANDDVVVGL